MLANNKNCCCGLIVTEVRTSVVDLQRVYWNKDSPYLEWNVLKFADYISVDLKESKKDFNERTVNPYQKLVCIKK